MRQHNRKLTATCVFPAACLLLFISSLNITSAKEQLIPTGTHGQGELRYVEGIPVAIFSGSAMEIGEQHAALLGKPAATVLDFPQKLFADSGIEESWPFAVAASKQLLMRAPARYREEIAAASKHDCFDIDKLNVANTLLELRRLGCSTLIIEPDSSATGGPLFGRNFDFSALGLLDKYSLVTVVRSEGKHAYASVGYPGLMGVLSGMNDAGLALATLDVWQAANASPGFEPSGVPLALVFRQILEECTTIAEAEELLNRTKATTWANLSVCDRDKGAVFEITATEVKRRDAVEAILPCTNHFRSSGLATDTMCLRYESLLSAAKHEKLDVAAVHDHLHRANQGERTLHTMVFEPRELVLHLAIGTPPTSALPLQRLELGPLFQAE